MEATTGGRGEHSSRLPAETISDYFEQTYQALDPFWKVSRGFRVTMRSIRAPPTLANVSRRSRGSCGSQVPSVVSRLFSLETGASGLLLARQHHCFLLSIIMRSLHEAYVRIISVPLLRRHVDLASIALHREWSECLEGLEGHAEDFLLLQTDTSHVEHSKHYPRHDTSRGRNTWWAGTVVQW